MNFKQWVFNEQKKQEIDISKTFAKLPKKHKELVKDYKIVFQPHNSLKGDDAHIGFIDEKNKMITIAAPWNYGREYTLLHEIGHAVWKYLVSEEKKEEWKKILRKEKQKDKKSLDQEQEEIFCMVYAQYYAKNKLEKYNKKSLIDFVSKI
jgi:hypothetical protein